jgi:putative transposase
MKGLYNGSVMNVYCAIPGYNRLARVPKLTKEATRRLKWLDYYHSHEDNARLSCRHFDISPQTFYRWKNRYNPGHIESLEAHSCRPRKLRQPSYTGELIKAVLELREEYPRWGKEKAEATSLCSEKAEGIYR